MIRYILAILLVIFSVQANAESAVEGLRLSEAPIKRDDMAAIKRGASFFATNCMSCHTLIYLKYDKVAQEAGITYDKMPINVTNWPNGITPPDLSLEADARGVDWIYTYLHSFYQDPSRPSGVNNLLVVNTGMANIVGPYQGAQQLVADPKKDLLGHLEWYDLLQLTTKGTMTPEQFDSTICDLVTFLDYAAEPFHAEQVKIGYWVLVFLVIMFILMYSLKVEYWKEVKKHKED